MKKKVGVDVTFDEKIQNQNKLKSNTAITLIALIITIIVLLILAGITLSMVMGDSGIFNKANKAKVLQEQEDAKELLKLELLDIKTEILTQEKRDTKIEDVSKLEGKTDVKSIEIKNEENYAIVQYRKYKFKINEKLEIIEEEKIEPKIEATYEITKEEGNKKNILITITSTTQIEQITLPTGNKIDIENENKNRKEIEWEIEEGQEYIFKIKVEGQENIEEYVLKAESNAKPIIKQIENSAYPILTQYGVKINKEVEIDYGENTENYYSIDNGQTWNKYTKAIKINEECTMIAKTIASKQITKIDKKQITLNLADDAMKPLAYDGDTSTQYYIERIEQYMMVDSEVIGKTVAVSVQYGSSGYCAFSFLDENRQTIASFDRRAFTIEETIPEGTRFIVVGSGKNLYEVTLKN